MAIPQAPSVGLWLSLIRTGLQVLAWVRQRAFVLPPFVWYWIVAVSALVAAVVTVIGLGHWWVPVLIALPAVLAAPPSLTWIRARRFRGKPLVFVARFADENPEHSSLAAVHLRQIERVLRRNEVLDQTLDLRFYNSPVKQPHAQQLLKWTRSLAVASGSGLLVDGHVRWEGWVLLRWPQMTGLYDRDKEGNPLVYWLSLLLSEVERAATRSDYEFETKRMTTDVFPAEHAQSIEGALLVAAAASHAGQAIGTRALYEADALRDALPLPALAVLEIGQAMTSLDELGDIVVAAEQLEAAGDAGANHIYLWNSCAALWTRAEQENRSSGADRVRVCEKGLQVAPDDFFAQSGAGIGYMALEQPEQAVPHLEQAVKNPDALDVQLLRQDLTRAYLDAGREDEARDQALLEYKAWPVSMRRAILTDVGMTEEEFLKDPLMQLRRQ